MGNQSLERTTDHTPGVSRPTWPRVILAIAIVAHALFFSLYQMSYHQAFWSGLDLTNTEQTIWNTLHGRFMRATIYPHTGTTIADFEGRHSESRLGDHVQPALLALIFPYVLVPRPEIFGVVLSISVALGALPLYSIARRRLRSESWALLFATGYLLLPAVETASGWDIHGTSFLPPLLLAALDAAQRGKRGWWWLWSLLAMGCREDLPFLIGWAMLWLAPRRQRNHAAVMTSLGLIWSLLAFLVIIPHFGGAGSPYSTRFFPSGTELSQNGILETMHDASFWRATATHFMGYGLRLGLPVFFLFLGSPRALMAMAPLLLLNGFSWYEPARHPELSHYSLPLIPWVLVGTVEGFIRLERWLGQWKLLRWRSLLGEALMASIVSAHIVSGYTPLSPNFVWPARTGREPTIQAMLDQIPEDAPISAEMHLAAHLAARETLRLFPDLRDAEWIVIDVWFGGDPYGSFANTWQHVMRDPTWTTVTAQDGLILLRKGQGPPQATEKAFQPSDTLVPLPLDAQFGGIDKGLHLHGLNIYCRAAGLCYLCLKGMKVGSSPLTPQVAVVRNGEVIRQSLMQGATITPRVYIQPGALQDCAQMLTGRGLRRPTLELSVTDATSQRLPVRLQDPGPWNARMTPREAALSISLSGRR